MKVGSFEAGKRQRSGYTKMKADWLKAKEEAGSELGRRWPVAAWSTETPKMR
jgi:hypothetical protein